MIREARLLDAEVCGSRHGELRDGDKFLRAWSGSSQNSHYVWSGSDAETWEHASISNIRPWSSFLDRRLQAVVGLKKIA